MRGIKFWLDAVYPIWLGIIMFFIFLPFSETTFSTEGFLFGALYMSAVTIPLTLPGLLILSRYVKHDKDVSDIIIDNQNIKLVNKNNEKLHVESVVLVRRNPKMDRGFDLLPWSKFYYHKLECSNSETYFISCLHELTDKLPKHVGVQFKKHPSIDTISSEEIEEAKCENELELIRLHVKLSNKSDKQLLDIVNSSEDYTQTAVKVAKSILDERDVDNKR
jgi:hypothetical protein